MEDVASGKLRWMASLLLLLLGIFAWRVLQSDTLHPKLSQKSKKKHKKKCKKKANASPAMESTTQTQTQVDALEPTQTTPIPPAQTQTQTIPLEEDESEDEDEDMGLKASKVLAKRVFKQPTVPIGGGRAIVSGSDSIGPRFAAQQRIMARFEGQSEWFPATIQEVKRGDRYTVCYDDGAIEFHVPSALIQDLATFKAKAEADAKAQSQQQQQETNDTSQQQAKEQPNTGDLQQHEATTEEESEDDGWQLVRKNKQLSQPKRPQNLPPSLDQEPELTKRQRENKRKKQRQKELKEVVRAQAQEQGLHARWGGDKNKYTYVRPPTSFQS